MYMVIYYLCSLWHGAVWLIIVAVAVIIICFCFLICGAFVPTSTLCGDTDKKKELPSPQAYMTTSPLLLTKDNDSHRTSTKPRSKATHQPQKQLCEKCGKTMPAIGTARKRGKRTHGDWVSRTLHKKCWKELRGRWWRTHGGVISRNYRIRSTFFLFWPPPPPHSLSKKRSPIKHTYKQIITRDATSHPVIETPAWRDR